MTGFDALRLGMVDSQIRVADVTDHRIIAAFLETPRENFVPAGREQLAYLDTRTPLGAPGRTMLDPMTLAKLIQLAKPRAQDRVLVVGCGLGYTAAVLAGLCAEVVGVEVDPQLAAEAGRRLSGLPNVKVVEGPLPKGAPDDGPFDLIFCDGAVETGLQSLVGQLAPAGQIVAPAGGTRAMKATIFRAHGDEIAAAPYFDASGPILPGFERVEAFSF
ncbi:MAG: protein-L-isoaspartate O-methyltransferase [Hansschlegelia sp.]